MRPSNFLYIGGSGGVLAEVERLVSIVYGELRLKYQAGLFNKFPQRVRNCMEKIDLYGIMADCTQLPFYSVLRLPLRVGDVKSEEVFLVSHINEDAILGMPFLVAHKFSMDCNQLIVQIDERKL